MKNYSPAVFAFISINRRPSCCRQHASTAFSSNKGKRQRAKESPISKINDVIDNMTGMEKEAFIEPSVYEKDDHIRKVLHKILRPDNAYTKFNFQNGRPQKSAILTTSSIEMAKRYYYVIKEMTKDTEWLAKEFGKHPIRKGCTIDDRDFPRIAITYSMQENEENAKSIQKEMAQIVKEYNGYYHTAWSIEDIERYNGDINNRLARKKAEFKEFGKHIDLVIVVERLLTGFDAPTIQTLFAVISTQRTLIDYWVLIPRTTRICATKLKRPFKR